MNIKVAVLICISIFASISIIREIVSFIFKTDEIIKILKNIEKKMEVKE